jgi:hypothetical protein
MVSCETFCAPRGFAGTVPHRLGLYEPYFATNSADSLTLPAPTIMLRVQSA